MNIFSLEQIREADRLTILNQNITSDALMERAGTRVFEWLDGRLQGNPVLIHVFCGIGNNGGDGLVIARLLLESGYKVKSYIVDFSEKRSKDFLLNLDRIKSLKHWPEHFGGEKGEELPQLKPEDIIVDAIFGVGLNRPASGWVGKLIDHINASGAFVLSVDMPSGLSMHVAPKTDAPVIQANHTLTFQSPKLAFFLPGSGVYTDSWEAVDIGLDAAYLQSVEPEAVLIGKQEALSLYIPRKKFSHKGTYGHALVIGGSYGKVGAVYLAGKACLSVGAGLLTTYLPKCGYPVLQTALPEGMVLTDVNEDHISTIAFDLKPTVIGIGVGLGRHRATVDAFKAFLRKNTSPLVVDADALNILSENHDLLELLPLESVLTPHPKELERLIGSWKDDFEKLEKSRQFAGKYNLILVIKGAHTTTIHKDRIYVNSTGNPGMATGGSGDVLTGMITGLISQGYTALYAAVFGVYLHGKAGDIAVSGMGYEALTATGIIDHIGNAFMDLFAREEHLPPEKEEEDPEKG
ncbi:NAD(P)H-hydrate dehydratase [Sinomicrobium weinanense]|uniref:Bifunctional NAD(P)H-hydrate repair enzyme n=1 Tax=Sinomicrobium weinanense TaxID=2842200 RepID=A0A926Q4V6_9FLAO|nr:NAD(P)H-hydrate dehydratase [Sinomicrobium weinanense]MBC9798399.1 NAD(P)H-hydrate dehydratase [Sinomicrobium weinanense]MBU3122586.1 NAD(P)H-hydrate dehydratase [Sinomicrobium weinanense]